jgi:hypothetical protein
MLDGGQGSGPTPGKRPGEGLGKNSMVGSSDGAFVAGVGGGVINSSRNSSMAAGKTRVQRTQLNSSTFCFMMLSFCFRLWPPTKLSVGFGSTFYCKVRVSVSWSLKSCVTLVYGLIAQQGAAISPAATFAPSHCQIVSRAGDAAR